jgi:hypothetical protein
MQGLVMSGYLSFVLSGSELMPLVRIDNFEIPNGGAGANFGAAMNIELRNLSRSVMAGVKDPKPSLIAVFNQ